MDQLVDLDAVADGLARRRASWTRRGLVVGELTWRDAAALWPQPILVERDSIVSPESVGLTFSRGAGVDAQLVLWTGGWADLELVEDDRMTAETPDFSDVESCLATVDALVDRLLAGTSSS